MQLSTRAEICNDFKEMTADSCCKPFVQSWRTRKSWHVEFNLLSTCPDTSAPTLEHFVVCSHVL